MRCFVVFFFALFVSFLAAAENDSCSFISSDSDCLLKGRVKIITSGSYDLKVRIFDGGSCDLYVKVFSTIGECHPDNKCGEIAFVDSGSYDVSVMFVDSGSYDLSIRFEDKRSHQRYVDAMRNAKN